MWSHHGITPGPKETYLVHANASLTAEGVAAESRLTRVTVRTGVTRFRAGKTRRWPTGPAARIAAPPG